MTKLTYRDAGLDLDLYEQSLACMPPLLKRTHTPRVLDGFGGFASLFSLDYNSRLFAKNYRHPVLVTCTDGVGSKLKVAGLMNKHDTVGIDLVAMSVNDCLCTGGEPLLFLDYLAMPRDDPALTRALIAGNSDVCMEADCALTGGETAILPDFYRPGDYDMAGFCVGVVEREHIINGRAIQAGDAVLGLASSGLHSNGYSLVRKVVFDRAGHKVRDFVPELGRTVGEELLEPTRIYVRVLKSILQHYPVKRRVVRGLAHITCEGLERNIPRVQPGGELHKSQAALVSQRGPVVLARQRHPGHLDGPFLRPVEFAQEHALPVAQGQPAVLHDERHAGPDRARLDVGVAVAVLVLE